MNDTAALSSLPPGLVRKAEALHRVIADLGSAAVAFSGGADSSLLLAAAHQALGTNATAITVDSPLSPSDDIESARSIAARIGASHEVIILDLLDLPEIASNPPGRCYYCKKAMMRAIAAYADTHGLRAVIEGTNADDEKEDRPGRKAIRELGIISPLREAGLTKHEVRSIARAWNLPSWDRPSSPCLATRVPFGTPLSREVLSRVDAAEKSLRGLGFREVRVRCHGDLARVEVSCHELPLLTAEPIRSKAASLVRKAGFAFVTLDLNGYRPGGAGAS